jgi:hypothetical protein
MRSKERSKGVQDMFNAFKGRFKGSSKYVQHFKSSIPLPYSLSKEGNLILESMNRFNWFKEVQIFNAQKIM